MNLGPADAGAGAAYVAALEWFARFADPRRGLGWNPRVARDPAENVPRMRALLDACGAPDRRLRCVLVAGTKGKGSTAAFLAALLAAHGVRTGLYTSPHLQSFRERVRVDGVAISPEAFVAEFERVREPVERFIGARPDNEPSAFEVLTALALGFFARSRCEIAVLEVGLGGRLDATNAVEPEVSVITSISLDHTAVLGPDLGSIAREKAGILRADRPAFIAEQEPAAREALEAACVAVGVRCSVVPPLPAGTTRLGLIGAHQLQNAALALAGSRILMDRELDDDAAATALHDVRWPGRFEVVEGAPAIVLDGAHNDASARALAATLRERFAERRIHLIVGINDDKDARAILAELLPLASSVHTTAAVRSPRALAPEVLAALCGDAVPVHAMPDVARALAAARAAADLDDVVCVTGSLALVGEARDALGLPVAERLW